MVDIEQAFNPETKSVHVVFQSPGIGYYIPLYQREYSWDNDNIEQLLFDVTNGIDSIITSNTEEIRFLGTIITVAEPNKRENIKPQDPAGLPSTVEKVIDGQQRLSTIALFSTILHDKFRSDILDKVNANNDYADEIGEICTYWMTKLEDIFSFDLRRGKPNCKPKIIRGNMDAWTKDGDINEYYKSDVSSYLAKYIGYINELCEKPKLNGSTSKVYKNLKQINNWFIKDVLREKTEVKNFPSAQNILSKFNQEHLWSYYREDLRSYFENELTSVKDRELISKLIKLSAVTHYLLERCCFTIIQPRTDDWAFDLFQSLNATGTPLTALETFHPLVVNNVEIENRDYKKSREACDFKQIDNLFSDTKTAAQKNNRTNDFLTSFAIVAKGEKLSSHFSSQRKWLIHAYNSLSDTSAKSSFVNLMGDYADFYKNYWLDFKPSIDISDSHKIKLAYLKDAGHKMAITVLGYFYYLCKKKENYSEFYLSIDIISSFYTIWRSSSSNTGLDNIYRTFFKGDVKNGLVSYNWNSKNKLEAKDLLKYLDSCLKDKGVDTYEGWFSKSKLKLNYKEAGKLCRYALILYYNNTIVDSKNPGLLKKAKKGTDIFLIWKNWDSGLYNSIEHIAPQKNDTGWDSELYDDSELFNTIGNLTLLPIGINSSLSNSSWIYKRDIYKIIGEKDKDKAALLIQDVEKDNLPLAKKLKELNELDLIKSATFICDLDDEFNWDKNFVQSRTNNILEILWDGIKFENYRELEN